MKAALKRGIRKYFFLILTLFILIFLQESFFSEAVIFGLSVNFFLIFVFLLVFFEKEKAALIESILAGLILDIFSFYPFGVFIFSLALSVFLIKKISKLLKKSNAFAFIFLFVLFLVIYNLSLIFSKFLFNLLLGL